MIITKRNLLLITIVLSVCTISFLHISLFSGNGIILNRVGRTMADFEKSECQSKLPQSHIMANFEKSACLSKLPQSRTRSCRRCPQGGIVTVYQGGRLGNQIGEYAAVLAVALQTGLEPYVPRCIRLRLEQVFETLTMPTLDEIAHCPVNLHGSVAWIKQWKSKNQSIVLPRYIFREDVVLVKEVYQEFTFRKELREKSEQVMATAALLCNGSCVFVGVHVRRTDFVTVLWRLFHEKPVEPSFFLTAMEYFESKYPSAVFVVVSDEPEWCARHLTKKNLYIASRDSASSPEQDMSIMAACNHSIVDYGTYGAWGALLAGGETIYHNSGFPLMRSIGKLLPNWHMLPKQKPH